MKKIKKIFLIAVTFIISVCGIIYFSGCKNQCETIYNDNSLIAKYNSYGDSECLVQKRANGLQVSSSSFSGVETLIYAFQVDSNTSAYLRINCAQAAVEGGKVKVVLADNSRVYVIGQCGKLSENFFLTSTNDDIDFSKIPSGIYSLKIIGVKVHFEMSFSY